MIWEVKRVLKERGTFLVSIPSEKILHPYIYPGLFTKRNFSEFLRLNSFQINRVVGWGQAAILSHWVKYLRERKNWLQNRLGDLVFYIGRKRNLLFRKRLGTPTSYAFCLNFVCINKKQRISRAEEVAFHTTPNHK